MKFNSFEDLFNLLFKEACSIEQHSIKILNSMLKKAYSKELKEALTTHLEETKTQATTLDRVLNNVGFKLETNRVCPIDSIVEAAEKCLNENESSRLLDAAIIAYAQQIEHVEIAVYGTLKEYADQLSESTVKDAVSDILKEEVKADTLLTKLASGGFFKEGINAKAV